MNNNLLKLKSILDNVDNILHEDIINQVSNFLDEIPEEEITPLANYIKDTVQKGANRAFSNVVNPFKAIIAATGVGKSKIAIDRIVETLKISPNAKILLVVPTEQLRDNNWKEEFDNWGYSEYWNKVERECYASISKLSYNEYELVIFDEFHNITIANTEFINNNIINNLMCLSATPPKNKEKKDLMELYGIKIVYEVTLDVAVKLRLVSPYEIVVVEARLDSKNAIIPAGTKLKPYLTTEAKQYEYLDTRVNKLMFSKNPKDKEALKFAIFNRMRFIYNLPTKTEVAKQILKRLPEDARKIIFCGSINQAEELSPYRFHSKSSQDHLKAFMNQEISELSCVKSLNEGMNVNGADYAVVVQSDSNDKNLIQRIGRLIRYKAGHIGKIIIIVCIDTVDEKWVQNSLEKLDKSKIRVIRYENLINQASTEALH